MLMCSESPGGKGGSEREGEGVREREGGMR